MAIAVTVTDKWDDGKRLHVIGTLVFSGSYPTGGDTLDFTGKVPASRAPLLIMVEGKAGFVYGASLGSTIANNLVLVLVEAAVGVNTALAQHTAVAYVAGVTGDTVKFYAIFKLL